MRIRSVANFGVKKSYYNNLSVAKNNSVDTLCASNKNNGISDLSIPYIPFCSGKPTNYIKEIKEQPEVIEKLANMYLPENKKVNLDLKMSKYGAHSIDNIKIIASGSSKNVGEMAKNFIEEVTGIPVDVEYASEFAHKKAVGGKNNLAIFISQSGETADTYMALNKAKEMSYVACDKSQNTVESLKEVMDGGYTTLALTNVETSKIHRGADNAINVNAGEEKAVAATKSVTAQLFNLYVIALKLAELRNTLSEQKLEEYKQNLRDIPNGIRKILDDTDDVKQAAEKITDKPNIIILARGYNVGAAHEGHLKLKETTYMNTIAYPSGDFLHGPIASVNEDTPVIQIMPSDKDNENYRLAEGNIKKIIKDRNAQNVIIIKDEDNKEIETDDILKSEMFLNIPSTKECFSPLYSVVKFQLLADELTKIQGKNPDSPDSLTKAVITE